MAGEKFIVREHRGQMCIETADGRLIPQVAGGEGDDAESDAQKPAGDAGGTPSKEQKDLNAAASDASDDESDGDEPGKKLGEHEKVVSRKRYDREVARATTLEAELKGLGATPAEVKAALSRLKEYDSAAEQVRAEAEEARRAATRDDKREALKMEVRQLLEEDDPGLFEDIRELREEKALYRKAHNNSGLKVIQGLLEEHGVKVTGRTLTLFKRAIGDEINASDETNAAYWNPETMEQTVKAVFNTVATDLLNPILQAAGAESLTKVKERREATLKRAPSGGTPTMKDEDEAFASKHPTGSPQWHTEFKAWASKRQDAILDHYGVAVG